VSADTRGPAARGRRRRLLRDVPTRTPLPSRAGGRGALVGAS